MNDRGPQKEALLSHRLSIITSLPTGFISEDDVVRGLFSSANCFSNVLHPCRKMSLEHVFLFVNDNTYTCLFGGTHGFRKRARAGSLSVNNRTTLVVNRLN